MSTVAAQAAIDAMNCPALVSPSPTPAGLSIYSKEAGNLVIAAIGAGTGLHGEENIQRICAAKNRSFQGGRIATYYYPQQAFIPACGQSNESNPDARNCQSLISDHGIDDVYQQFHKRLVSERNGEIQDATAVRFFSLRRERVA